MLNFENCKRLGLFPTVGLCFLVKVEKDRQADAESFSDFFPSIEINGTIYETIKVEYSKVAVAGTVKAGTLVGIVVKPGNE